MQRGGQPCSFCRASGDTASGSGSVSRCDEDYGRLELQCTDVIIDVSAGGDAGGVSAAVRLYALSALEYLPSEDAA